MPNVLTLNTDGSFLEITPVIISTGASSAGEIPALNAEGYLDPSMIATTNYDGGSASQAPGIVNIDMGAA